MPEPLGTVERREHDGVSVARLSGEIDLSNREPVARRLRQAVDEGLHLVVDLETLSYLDSSGIRMLFELQDLVAAGGRSLCLVATPDLVVWRVLTLTGLTAAVPHRPTVHDAVASVWGTTRDATAVTPPQ